ncbi:hypothetical protein SAMN04487995_1707 [Dyadobacter koreensis]|uniref:Uncharacterized protein n=1 Tax=Dyadobacter koreensis TaxID=408657 RepID=A0A1H6S2Y9_9BACT|nr:hypothetical protein [Dyadobacter koreensis]SEI62311.1 hypothetical protein SAMN04487995_1707 [Dyadobacter koreensis]
MKPYSEYSAEELAMENLFIRWVRFPNDPPIRSFWENWMTKYPNKKDTVEQARELVLITSEWKTDTLSNQDVNSIWDRIRNSLEIIKEREPGEIVSDKNSSMIRPKNIILGVISMAVLGLLCLILLYIR